MSNIFIRGWAAVKSWFKTDAETGTIHTVMVELTAAEHTLLEKFHPLFNQSLATKGTQGVKIVDDAFTGVMATVASGGNIGAGISAAASEALSQIETAATADAKNAVYGLLAASVASLPVTGTSSAPAPAPAPEPTVAA